MSRFCIALSAFLALVLLAGLSIAPLHAADSAASIADTARAADTVELFRLRVVNRHDGAIQVSTDAGVSWCLIGRVISPATTVAEGYTAAQYAQPGTVAAVAVHGIRIRVGTDDPTLHDPLVLSIDPIEFGDDNSQNPNKGYGGQVTGSAGILTDIHVGHAIFRELSPRVGNQVFVETLGGNLRDIGSAFRPTGQGETLVITVTAPKVSLTEVSFENKPNGAVKATWSDGTEREITRVVQPVLGVGRFDGTAYTGLGRLNTDHTGVITVSTVPVDGAQPEGEGRERRGGFQISPAWHNARLEEAGAPMVMTLGNDPSGHRRRELEGTAPLFRSDIALGDSDPESAVFDVSIDDGPWEPMPVLIGNRPTAFTAAGLNTVWKEQGIVRFTVKGVTAFRLRLAAWDSARAHRAAEDAIAQCRAARYAVAVNGHLPIVKGVLTVNANPTNGEHVAFVRLLIEGTPNGFTNVSPFALTWNTTTVPDGEYLVEADALDEEGAVLAITRHKVFVLNHRPPPRPVAAVQRLAVP